MPALDTMTARVSGCGCTNPFLWTCVLSACQWVKQPGPTWSSCEGNLQERFAATLPFAYLRHRILPEPSLLIEGWFWVVTTTKILQHQRSLLTRLHSKLCQITSLSAFNHNLLLLLPTSELCLGGWSERSQPSRVSATNLVCYACAKKP